MFTRESDKVKFFLVYSKIVLLFIHQTLISYLQSDKLYKF